MKGVAKKDLRTKNLVKRLVSGDIAFLAHQDIDVHAAEALVQKKIKAVVNAYPSITGRYKNMGPKVLLENNITVLDSVGMGVFDAVQDGETVEIRENGVFRNGTCLGRGTPLEMSHVSEKIHDASKHMADELERFVENTLSYLHKEKDVLLGELHFSVDVDFSGKHVLVVVRGKNYKQDLEALRAYIQETRPVLVGVDGGADALAECGYKPHVIVGDMDSVSDETLRCGAKLVVHAYPDGRAPGLERVKKLGLSADVAPLPGMSEDLALLLAYHKGAEMIAGVGIHFSLDEFLEKERKGMASTFLVRLKVGDILFDAKGVSRLYRRRIGPSFLFGLIVAGLVPVLILLFLSPVARPFLKLLKITLQKNFGF